MLTATPINNKLTDMRNMIELFTNKDESYFSRTLDPQPHGTLYQA